MSVNPLIDRAGWIHTVKLRVPIDLALGLYERLSDEQLADHFWDISHEIDRRGLNPMTGERLDS